MAHIEIGSLAPDFTARTWKDVEVTLSAHQGRKVWLAFFRYASCPLCNLRVHEIEQRYEELVEKGLDVLAVFQSTPERVAQYVGKQEPRLTLLCDPAEALYQQYGLGKSLLGYVSPTIVPKIAKALRMGFKPGPGDGTQTRLPGDFLIDEKGVVRDVYMAHDIAHHIPFARIDTFLSK